MRFWVSLLSYHPGYLKTLSFNMKQKCVIFSSTKLII